MVKVTCNYELKWLTISAVNIPIIKKQHVNMGNFFLICSYFNKGTTKTILTILLWFFIVLVFYSFWAGVTFGCIHSEKYLFKVISRADKTTRAKATSSVKFSFVKVNNRNTRKRCEIRLKLTIKTPDRHHYPTLYISVRFPEQLFVLLQSYPFIFCH